MAMFGYFQNDFEMAPEKPKAKPKPKTAAAKATAKPVARQHAALRAPNAPAFCKTCLAAGKNKENQNHEKLCSDRKLRL